MPVDGPTLTQRQLFDIESQILQGPAGSYLDTVASIKRDLASESPDVRARLFDLVAPQVEAAATTAMGDAFAIGRTSALAQLGEGHSSHAQATSLTSSTEPTRALGAITGIDAKLAASIEKARRLSASGADDATVFAPVFAGANNLKGAVTWATNSAGNDGVIEVANVAQVSLVWVAEFDACVECLAYSGRTCGAGDTFPEGLTYGAVTYADTSNLEAPPLHPNCRCTVEVLGDQSYADALRREADRSILRGFSLESESMGVRLDAAQRLLDNGVVAPKSVQKYAANAIKEGAFPTRGRPDSSRPPSGDPAGDSPTPTTRPPAPSLAPEYYSPASNPSVPLSETLKGATTPTEAAAMMAERHPDVEVLGFGAKGINLKQATDALGQVSKLLDKFPNLKLSAVEAFPIKKAGVFAQVRTPRIGISSSTQGSATYGVPRMEISLSKLRNPETQVAMAAHAHATGQFHDLGDHSSPMIYTVTHEFGHVLDANLQFGGRAIVNGAKRDELARLGIKGVSKEGSAWEKENISGYGRSSGGEHVAEAFANVETSGAEATPLSQLIYQRLLDAYEKITP